MNSSVNAPSNTRVPPRFVPTLTEVVDSHMLPKNPVPSEPSLSAESQAPLAADLNQQILHRVMQRVDASLSQTLRQAVAELVLNHTQLLLPLIREEIEQVVRDAVNEAVAQELQGPNAS